MLILFKVFFAGPVNANIKTYANNACRPLFEKNCGNNNNTIQLKERKKNNSLINKLQIFSM